MSEFNIFGTADRLLSALQRSFLLLRRTPAHAPKLPWTFWQNNAPRGYNLAVEAETAMRYCPNLKSAVQSAEKAVCTARGFWDTELKPMPRWQQFEAASDEIGLA